MDEDLQALPHVGGLFDPQRKGSDGIRMGNLDIADYDARMRRTLLEACGFDWGKISPIVFGTMFEDAMEAGKRRSLGAHYTSERNIRKVIDPLFMDDLRKEYQDCKSKRGEGRGRALKQFHEKLGNLKFLDPACGCGNFLIVAYKNLRELEMDVIRSRREAMGHSGQKEIAQILSVVDVDQFHGIELGEFPAKIAEAGLWMMDHVMNNKLSQEFGEDFARIPIRKHPSIFCADALDMDWEDACPANECDFVMGNPPFIGVKEQSAEQRKQMKSLGKDVGMLDYVSSWFIKGSDYIKQGGGKMAFVSTKTICQGEQASTLWPQILGPQKQRINFAHRSFPWKTESRGGAAVSVIMVGVENKTPVSASGTCRLYEQNANGENMERAVKSITPYLTDGGGMADPHAVVRKSNYPMNEFTDNVRTGTKLTDWGHLTLNGDNEKQALCNQVKGIAEYIRPYVGGQELLHGNKKHVLCLTDAPPSILRHPAIKKRLDAVRELRGKSNDKGIKSKADFPTEFERDIVSSDQPMMVLPQTSSGHREWLPVGVLPPDAVASISVMVWPDAPKWHLAMLSSSMHMAWLRRAGSWLGDAGMRYSLKSVYNTMPLPDMSEKDKERLEKCADAIVKERSLWPNRTLAELYDPSSMPKGLRSAHMALDKAVDKLYGVKAGLDAEARADALNAPLRDCFSAHDRRQARGQTRSRAHQGRQGRQAKRRQGQAGGLPLRRQEERQDAGGRTAGAVRQTGILRESASRQRPGEAAKERRTGAVTPCAAL